MGWTTYSPGCKINDAVRLPNCLGIIAVLGRGRQENLFSVSITFTLNDPANSLLVDLPGNSPGIRLGVYPLNKPKNW